MTPNEKINLIAGREVEITFRDIYNFTFSWDGRDDVAAQKIADYFHDAKSEIDYDAECDHHAVYIDLK